MVDPEELEFLDSLVDDYRQHFIKFQNSLLLRVAGLYKIRLRPIQHIFSFLVMYNTAPFKGIFVKYDLKGSVNGRRERPADVKKNDNTIDSQWTGPGQFSGTLLDLDYIQDCEEFGRPVEVSLEDKEAFMEQVWHDVHFLAQHRVMDYSMLVCRGMVKGDQPPAAMHALHVLKGSRDNRFPRPKDPAGYSEYFVFSFIDISQEYTSKKAWEHFAKVSVLRKGKYRVSSSPPGYYGKRFVERMNEYILPKLPDDSDFMRRHHQFDWEGEYNFYTKCCCCGR